jgi:hypothetical protein
LDIDSWLRRIGLEQYAQTFRDNAIDADVLRDLTDEHLRELGLPLGARLKLLRAVAALGTSEQTPASPEITPPAPSTRPRAQIRCCAYDYHDVFSSRRPLAAMASWSVVKIRLSPMAAVMWCRSMSDRR